MIVESVELKDYRNYEFLDMKFNAHVNIIYGDNAQGKTNILESIYMCSTSKSHRGSKDREIVRFGEDESHIKLNVLKHGMKYRIDMHLKKNKSKGIAVNGIPIKKAVDLFGIINIVFFSPEDLNIIKNGPSERRRFMDMELSQLDKIYLSNLVNYNKVLNQRNKLLKDIAFSPSEQLMQTLDIWDMQLVKYGSLIIKGRKSFIEKINTIISDIHSKLTGGIENIKVCYVPDVDVNDFEEEVKNSRQKDIKYKATSKGPHKDDLIFLVNDNDVRKYGSQGQQRTAALSLKLSEIEAMGERSRIDYTILLAEDSPLLLEMLKKCLTKAGYSHLIPTSNGLEAWNTLDRMMKDGAVIGKDISLVITDIEMPQMDGHHLTKKIKEDPRFEGLPVVIFSSLVNDEMKRKGEALGVDAQLSKPEIGRLVHQLDLLLK